MAGRARGPDLYQRMGGTAACRRLATAFYARVEQDPLLRPLFPGKTFRCAIEEFSAFLVQFLGGPSEDAQRRWWLSLRESHLRFKIGRKERDAWMSHMVQALDESSIEAPVRSALRGFFEQSSSYLVNNGETCAVAEVRGLSQEMDRRWAAQLALDEAVAAVRSGDADGAIRLAGSSTLLARFESDRAVLAALLAVMIGSGESVLLEYVHEKLRRDPALVRERYSGRTLLHTAAAAGSLSTVAMLLRLGADPNTTDAGGHTPLYCLGNECSVQGAGSVVRILVHSGANVDARDGVKCTTALHMAARRGNVEVADALLDCGADLEARDTLGDTPLRRAVNCGKIEVTAFLLSRGADGHSKGSRGMTPLSAARTSAMKLVLTRANDRK